MAVKPQKEMEDTRERFEDEDSDRAYDVAVSLAESIFYDQEHLNGLMSAIQKSRDPSKIVGQAVGQVLLVAYNKANQAELNIDDRVWAADEGVLDTLVGEAVEFMSETGVQVDPQSVKQAAMQVLQDSPQPEQQQQGQQSQPQATPAPQGVMPK